MTHMNHEIIEGEIVTDTPPDAFALFDLLRRLEPVAERPKRQPSPRALGRQYERLYLRRIGYDMSERKVKVIYKDNPATIALAVMVGSLAGGLFVWLLFGGV